MRLESKFYLNWLAISVPEGITPDHYTLLGIRSGETDIAIIDQAADVRFCMMRKADIGEHPDEFREMLRQLETARAELIFPLRNRAAVPAAAAGGYVVTGKEIIQPETAPERQNAVEHDGSLVGWKSKAIFFTQCAVAFGLGMCVCVSMMMAAQRHPDGSVNFTGKEERLGEAAPYTTLPDADGKRPDVVHIDDKIRELVNEIPTRAEESEAEAEMLLDPIAGEEPVLVQPDEPAPVVKTDDITPIPAVAPEDEEAEIAPVSTRPPLRSPGGRRVSPLKKIRSENTIAQNPVTEPEMPDAGIAPEVDAVLETPIVPETQLVTETHAAETSPATPVLPDSLDLESFSMPEAPADLANLPSEPEIDMVVVAAAVVPETLGLPVPALEELQVEQVKLQDELAKRIKTPANRLEMITRLFDGATGEDVLPVKRYVALDAALSLAVLEHDSLEAMKILEKIDYYFEIDGATARHDVVQELGRQLTQEKPEGHSADVQGFLTLGQDACQKLVSARRFEMAARLSDVVSNVCSEIGSDAEKRVAVSQKVRFNSLWDRWNGYMAAMETLKTSPEDREANLVVGLWLGELERKLDEALPYFARSMDDSLRGLARQELGMTDVGEVDSQAILKLGDGWWQLAEAKTYPTGMRKVMRDHAISIYKEIEPLVDDPMAKTHISSRIKQTEAVER